MKDILFVLLAMGGGFFLMMSAHLLPLWLIQRQIRKDDPAAAEPGAPVSRTRRLPK